MSEPHVVADNHSSRFTNRLAHEKSPYLLQHAHNPVDWYPWGAEAMEKARAEDKPVFLSVGYSACHWCHVMERESFENEAVAQILNENFVCVKVDREERPDVDEVYMTAVQMMTGHGGWPMSVFLTPDGKPFYGGTYFPPDGNGARVGFGSLITQLADAFRTRRDEAETVAESVSEDLRKITRQRPVAGATSGELDAGALLAHAVAEMTDRFDAQTGGFGDAPKFPPHHALRLLVKAYENGDTDALPILTTTLDRMAQGGIYDHVGGGFHRYATDAVWLLPHFEKMLYDNALLAGVYAEASKATGKTAYGRIARETCDWVLRDMTDETGGFHAALDADSEGEEGKYYVWTVQEVNDILGADAGLPFAVRYNIRSSGNFRDEATGHATGTNIPHLAVGKAAATAPLPDALDAGMADALLRLRLFRDRRIAPGKDFKVITAWNGLMIGALARAGRILNEPRHVDAAVRAAAFCRTTLTDANGNLLRRYAKGEAGLPAFLDDYAYLADGLLDLYEATGEEQYRAEAERLTDVMIARFWDAEESGFFYTSSDGEALIARPKDLFDNATPSPNGVAARALARLGNLPNGARFGETARALLTAYRGVLERAPQGCATLILAAQDAFAVTKGEAPPLPLAAVPATNGNAETPVELTTGDGQNPLQVAAGGATTAAFLLRIAPGYHVNAHHTEGCEYLISTVATIATDAPAAVGPVTYPAPTLWQGGGESLPTFQGTAPFEVPIAVVANAAPGRYSVTLTVRFQPCSETACLAPAEQTATVVLEVVAP